MNYKRNWLILLVIILSLALLLAAKPVISPEKAGAQTSSTVEQTKSVVLIAESKALLLTPASPVLLEYPTPLSISDLINQAFPNAPIMLEVARCESGRKQFRADGTVLRGIANPLDVGIFQINEKYHLADSIKRGIDIYTVEGNIKMAKVLYNQSGTQPWSASKPCWGK